MMSSIGERLRSERERLGLNQEELGQLAGVTRNTQANYERDSRQPDTGYLLALHNAGVDIYFVITGVRQRIEKLSPQQSYLIDSYERATPAGQQSVMVVMEALANYAVAPGSLVDANVTKTADDAELWRSIARGLPTAPGVDPNSQLRLVDFLAVVEEA